MIAIMTNGFVAFDVMGQRNGTVGAVFNVATGRALNAGGKTSPIEQQDDLAIVLNALLNFLSKFLTDRTKSFPSAEINSQINRRDIGQRQIKHPFFQTEFLVLSGDLPVARFPAKVWPNRAPGECSRGPPANRPHRGHDTEGLCPV